MTAPPPWRAKLCPLPPQGAWMLFDMACVRCLRVLKHRGATRRGWRVPNVACACLHAWATWRLPRPQRMGATRRVWRMQQTHACMGSAHTGRGGPACTSAPSRTHTHARTRTRARRVCAPVHTNGIGVHSMAGVLKLCTSVQVHILLAAAKIDESGDCAVPAVIRLSTRSFERVTQLVTHKTLTCSPALAAHLCAMRSCQP